MALDATSVRLNDQLQAICDRVSEDSAPTALEDKTLAVLSKMPPDDFEREHQLLTKHLKDRLSVLGDSNPALAKYADFVGRIARILPVSGSPDQMATISIADGRSYLSAAFAHAEMLTSYRTINLPEDCPEEIFIFLQTGKMPEIALENVVDILYAADFLAYEPLNFALDLYFFQNYKMFVELPKEVIFDLYRLTAITLNPGLPQLRYALDRLVYSHQNINESTATQGIPLDIFWRMLDHTKIGENVGFFQSAYRRNLEASAGGMPEDYQEIIDGYSLPPSPMTVSQATSPSPIIVGQATSPEPFSIDDSDSDDELEGIMGFEFPQ